MKETEFYKILKSAAIKLDMLTIIEHKILQMIYGTSESSRLRREVMAETETREDMLNEAADAVDFAVRAFATYLEDKAACDFYEDDDPYGEEILWDNVEEDEYDFLEDMDEDACDDINYDLVIEEFDRAISLLKKIRNPDFRIQMVIDALHKAQDNIGNID